MKVATEDVIPVVVDFEDIFSSTDLVSCPQVLQPLSRLDLSSSRTMEQRELVSRVIFLFVTGGQGFFTQSVKVREDYSIAMVKMTLNTMVTSARKGIRVV